LVCALVLAGCGGGSGLAGSLEWEGTPKLSGHTVSGTVRNTTSNTQKLDPRSFRFLTPDGRSLDAKRVHMADPTLSPGQTTRVSASWTATMEPSRLDYGAGALRLPFGARP
jgi:hypothetical protein